jgi:hypothetical protein
MNAAETFVDIYQTNDNFPDGDPDSIYQCK